VAPRSLGAGASGKVDIRVIQVLLGHKKLQTHVDL